MGLHTHNMGADGLRWYHEYFGQLVGATIIGFELAHEPDEDEYWPNYKVKLKDGSVIMIELSQDEEGNGPGFLFGLPSVGPASS